MNNQNVLNNTIQGLTTTEAKALLQKFGKNEIKETGESFLIHILRKFITPIPLMIEGAFVLSLFSGHVGDAIIIAVLLGVNVGVDVLQESKANKALAALKNTLSPKAVVLRDGAYITMPASELVPGDIVKIIIGDIVPADLEILETKEIQTDQSTITGESLPVVKGIGDTLYASSVIQMGNAVARVTGTGLNTYIGKSASLVSRAAEETESHFQKAIFGIGRFLMVAATVLIVIVSFILIHRGDTVLETVRFALVLAVASIPVALPAVLSVTMALGARILAKKKAIVSHFATIEELAGVDTLCVDKTGTLTKNELAIGTVTTYGKYTEEDLFVYALLASEKDSKSSIEKTLYNYAHKKQFDIVADTYIVKDFVPFDPVHKITRAIALVGSTEVEVVMGAPQIVEAMVLDDSKEQLSRDIQIFAQKGFRTLAIAKKEQKGWHAVGSIPLLDPPRDDSKQVLEYIKEAGVRTHMLTGDNTLIARYIAKLLSIGEKILTADALHSLFKNKEKKDIDKAVCETDVFAEVTPEDKYNIVSVFQDKNNIVAMTGDGVNDAPALKKADVGIAVSGASPAARSAADIVLLSSGLSVIKDAIVASREIFSRMQSYATFRIAETVRILLLITLALVFFNESPITAGMIILLALLNDIPVMTIAYDNARASKTPTRWHLYETIVVSTVLGITGLVGSFILFWWLSYSGIAFALIQTIMFLKLDVAGHSTLYVTRTGRNHFWHKPYPSLKFFLPAFGSRIIGTIIATVGILMQPIGLGVVALIWLYATAWFVIDDYVKVFTFKILDAQKKRKSYTHTVVATDS